MRRGEGRGWSAYEERCGRGQEMVLVLELAHSEESDHTIASSTARAARTGLRLRIRGECIWNAVYVCEW